MIEILKLRKNFFLIFLITFFLYIPFLNKAFHIDSPVTVHGARQLSKDLLNPPLGEYGQLLSKWNQTGIDTSSFYHATPHPPLVLIYLAPFVKIFGDREFIINFVMFPFYLFSIVFFYLLARRFFGEDSIFLSIIFALSPAVFVNSQNVMLDTPLMCMTLASFYFLFNSDELKNVVFAGIFAGLACLIKYTAGTLFFSAILYFVLKKEYKKMLYFLIPLLFLNGIWFIHNLFILGKSQLISNEHAYYIMGDIRYRFERMISYIGGAWFLPIIPVALFLTLKDKLKFIILSVIILLPLTAFLIFKKSYNFGEAIFYLVSALSFIILTYSLISLKDDKFNKVDRYTLLSHWTLQLLGGPFLTLYAVRYTLLFGFLTIYALQLLIQHQRFVSKKLIYVSTIVISLIISIGLSISDYQICGANRRVVEEVRRLKGDDQKVYFQGRLGYLYYMNKAGFVYFDKEIHNLKEGDLLLRNHYFSGDGGLFSHVRGKIEKVAEFNYPIFRLVPKGGKSGFYGYNRLSYWFLKKKQAKRAYTLYRYVGN